MNFSGADWIRDYKWQEDWWDVIENTALSSPNRVALEIPRFACKAAALGMKPSAVDRLRWGKATDG